MTREELQFYITETGMTRTEFAREANLVERHLYRMLSGEQPITSQTVARVNIVRLRDTVKMLLDQYIDLVRDCTIRDPEQDPEVITVRHVLDKTIQRKDQ